MEENVKLSDYCRIITALIIITIAVALFLTADRPPVALTIAAISMAMLISGLLYAPRRIAVSATHIIIKSYLRTHRIPLRDVTAATLYAPTMGAVRILGSSGFMGYWGIFREGDTGRYAAWYGRASDCFMVRMANGDKYVLGCENASEMTDYINSLIS